ncbi:MAG TPA: hypothetical protein VJ385_06720 [Fibrobacteria bacterium]|nr:hypothetical protein [Fibrobacteria bacterium]
MKIPVNLLVFLVVAGVFYLYILPKKTKFVSGVMEGMGIHRMGREDSVKTMVTARIIVDLCPKADLSEYRPGHWSEYHSDESGTNTEITHSFVCDGEEKLYLFRLHYGVLAEIINLR